jgi:hypothetical protein
LDGPRNVHILYRRKNVARSDWNLLKSWAPVNQRRNSSKSVRFWDGERGGLWTDVGGEDGGGLGKPEPSGRTGWICPTVMAGGWDRWGVRMPRPGKG